MYYGNNESIILTDVDGVLLNWIHGFDIWMAKRGFKLQEEFKYDYNMAKRYDISEDYAWEIIKRFNDSAAIRNLPPLRDAIKYVRKLHEEHGFVFHVITSLSLDEDACMLRIENLENLFGKGVFERYVFCDTGAHKRDRLIEYKDTGLFWIEDNYDNCVDGAEVGLEPLLMNHYFNTHIKSEFPRVFTWKDIHDHILGE